MSNPLRKRPNTHEVPKLLVWASEVENLLRLPPLNFRGFVGDRNAAKVNRANLICEVINLFDRPARLGAAAAFIRASERKARWLAKAKEWKDPPFTRPQVALGVYRTLMHEDKELWLLTSRQTECMIWEALRDFVVESASSHSFTKKELVLLVASTDPELRMLGLRLMAKTKR